ncbi:MAG TPA: RHS repeat-associated core domain-containing protein, partial [Trichormus sp.]
TREYSSALGRWISRDSIEELGGANMFAYVGNDPVMYADPSGTFRCLTCKEQWQTIYNVTNALTHYGYPLGFVLPFDYYNWSSIRDAAGLMKDLPNPPCPNIFFFFLYPWLRNSYGEVQA